MVLSRRDLRLVMVALAVSILTAACGPTLKQVTISEETIGAERERQFELAFTMMRNRHERLQTVALPLLVAGVPLCEDDAKPLYGIELHDRAFYRRVLGEEFERVAVKQYGLAEGVYIRYIHPALPAGRSGLRIGDRVLAIDEVPLAQKSATEVMKILWDRDHSSDMPLSLTIEREGQRLTLTIPISRACRYPVILVNQDAVNAYADGDNVGITKGMIRFAERDEELALVVGHEIAHNALGHVQKKIGQTLLGTIVDLAIAITTGVQSGIFQGWQETPIHRPMRRRPTMPGSTWSQEPATPSPIRPSSGAAWLSSTPAPSQGDSWLLIRARRNGSSRSNRHPARSRRSGVRACR